MSKKVRLALVVALAAGSLLVGAPPAAATCRPEDKVPCETEFPRLREMLENCSTSFDAGLPVTLGVCDL